MAKTTGRGKRGRPRPDALTITAALERARLRRLVAAKRDIARLATQLRRVHDAADAKLLELARDIAKDHDAELTYTGSREAARVVPGVGEE
jgi:hypothetical protein